MNFVSQSEGHFLNLVLVVVSLPSRPPAAAIMPETAESHAVALTTNRNCVIEITNVSTVYCLVNPK